MPNNKIIRQALIDALLTAAYVALVGSVPTIARYFFGDKGDNFLIPIAMLMLFVFSAALCGTLFFGYPIKWYLDGYKKEAFKLVGYTIGFFLVVTLIAVLGMILLF